MMRYDAMRWDAKRCDYSIRWTAEMKRQTTMIKATFDANDHSDRRICGRDLSQALCHSQSSNCRIRNVNLHKGNTCYVSQTDWFRTQTLFEERFLNLFASFFLLQPRKQLRVWLCAGGWVRQWHFIGEIAIGRGTRFWTILSVGGFPGIGKFVVKTLASGCHRCSRQTIPTDWVFPPAQIKWCAGVNCAVRTFRVCRW